MVVYTVHKDLLEDENPYSIWRDDVELIEDRLSYGEAVYWCFRELQEYVDQARITKQQMDALMGDIEAYDELVLNLVPA
mgnify:CR=1 FL=1|jgi:hypothetical protein